MFVGVALWRTKLRDGLHHRRWRMGMALGHLRLGRSHFSASEPSVGRGPGSERPYDNILRNPVTEDGKHGVGDTEMEIFNNLHIVGRNRNTNVTQAPHFSALKPRQTDSGGPSVSGYLQCP